MYCIASLVAYPSIALALHEIRAVCAVHQVTPETIALALSLAERYRSRITTA